MDNRLTNFMSSLSGLTRGKKILIQLVIDASTIATCLIAAMLIRLETVTFLEQENFSVVVSLVVLITLFAFYMGGVYLSLIHI